MYFISYLGPRLKSPNSLYSRVQGIWAIEKWERLDFEWQKDLILISNFPH